MKKAAGVKPLKALSRPGWKAQIMAFDIVRSKKFDALFMAFIGLNMVTAG